MWLGPVAFSFYVCAVIQYIQSEAASRDSDIINCFASILEFRLEHERDELSAIGKQLASIGGYIVEHYDRFDLELGIYGDVRSAICEVARGVCGIAGANGELIV